ncbi:MAG TPA: hypothetical protein VKT75_10605 [Acidobacteriaceae bacterium]|nr:hypothetical protein [Acidobacteriaceae bacterium]
MAQSFDPRPDARAETEIERRWRLYREQLREEEDARIAAGLEPARVEHKRPIEAVHPGGNNWMV